jgi:hypothetical protein
VPVEPLRFTVATGRLLLLHVPPALALVSVVVDPVHAVVVPVLAASGLTVTVAVAEQLPTVYVTSAVPAPTPVTTPVAGTIVAIDVVGQLHVPPGVLLVTVVVLVIHTTGVPPKVPGPAVTVTTRVTKLPPAV